MSRQTKKFTQDELKFLITNRNSMTISELADELGRPYSSVAHKLLTMGIQAKPVAHEAPPQEWWGCEKTCPDYCPYKDCKMPTKFATIGYREDFKELFEDDKD